MATQQKPAATETPSVKPVILLVEDEPSVSKVVGKLLDEAGYVHVSIAEHSEIPAAILRWKPRCIILDSDPGSAGHARSWADAAAIRREHPHLPVLMFTADSESMAEARAKTSPRSRAADYAGVLDKPFLIVEFLATLKSAVDTSRGGNGASRAQPAAVANAGLAAEAITVFPDVSGAASEGWATADFFSMAVHELKTPLTSIDGQTQLAQRALTKDPTRAADALVRVREQTKRMNRLIGDLLDYGRVGAGALSLDVVTFDLAVAAAITVAQHEHGDAPRITFAATEPVRIQGDPDRVAQILGNLLDNAIRYSAPGSAVDVSIARVGNEAQIRVTDRGVGLPKDERGRLFTPFFRSSRTREIAGNGLGLHISRRIAEQHRGKLWLDATSEFGSTFILALPLAG
jgi:signal transduction histidine kinase